MWPGRPTPKRASGPPKLNGPWTGKIFDAVVLVPVSVAGTGGAAGAAAAAGGGRRGEDQQDENQQRDAVHVPNVGASRTSVHPCRRSCAGRDGGGTLSERARARRAAPAGRRRGRCRARGSSESRRRRA